MKLVRYAVLVMSAMLLFVVGACGGSNIEDPVCGNNVCESGEDASSCAQDCDTGAVCGNSTCEAGESNLTCPEDCTQTTCGNGTCDASEDATSCPSDCSTGPVCGNGTCEAGEDATSCASDCGTGPVCGNGTCEAGEDATSCASDCGGGTDCSPVVAGANIGAECQGQAADFCGAGGRCLTFDAAAAPTCYQICSPGVCVATCTGDEQCLSVTDQDGNPMEIVAGLPLGVCDEPPVGTNGAYDRCGGAAGACEAGLDCLSITGATSDPYCAPRCSDGGPTCPDREGVAGACVLGNPGTNCAMLCTVGSGTCPAGMECMDVGGAGACLWPETI